MIPAIASEPILSSIVFVVMVSKFVNEERTCGSNPQKRIERMCEGTNESEVERERGAKGRGAIGGFRETVHEAINNPVC